MDDQARGGPRPGEDNEPAGLSPVRAFLLLGALLAAIFAGFLATREATPATETVAPARSPDYSLTDAEAIARFHELHGFFRAASKNRDVSLLDVMLAPQSPLHEVARRQISQLVMDDVLDRSVFAEEQVEVVSNTSSRIEIVQVVVIEPRFVSAVTDRVVSRDPELRQRVRWVLTLDGSVWKVFDSEVMSSKEVR